MEPIRNVSVVERLQNPFSLFVFLFLFFYFFIFLFFFFSNLAPSILTRSPFPATREYIQFQINCRPVIPIKVYHNNKVFFSARPISLCTSCSSIVNSKNTILYPSHICTNFQKVLMNCTYHFVRFLSYEN